MPTNRFNYSDDFVLNNGKVGINSSSPQEKLDVVGITKAENLSVVGVSSLTGYEGFLRANHNIVESTSLEGGQGTTGSLSGEIVIGTGVTVTGVTTATSGQGYIDSLKVYNTFTVPVGGTEERPTKAKPGQLYYNKDFASIEFFDGDRWRQVDNTTQRGRGVFAGGVNAAADSRVIEYINISSLGNSQNFGDLTVARYSGAGMSNSVRGVFGGGWATPSNNLDIYYVTIASEGNAIDFGVDVTGGWGSQGTSSSTRGLAAGGNYPAGTNVIDTILFATTGVKYDYGDLAGHGTTNDYRGRGMTGCNSPTRSVFFGGYNPALTSVIESKLTASDGNTVFFGDLISKLRHTSGLSSSTRGVIGSGTNQNSNDINLIQYITISTFGNASYFGDLTVSRRGVGAVSTQTRGVLAGGHISPVYTNAMDYITISSAGNAVDFGDLSQTKEQANTASDSHGGLGGF